MSGPWEDFAADGPWSDFAADPTPKATARRKDKGVLRKIDAGIRGAADMVSFGFADEFAAAMDSIPALAPGGESYSVAFDRNVAEQRAMDAADKEQTPVSRGTGQVAGFGMTLGASLATAPRAAAPAAAGLRGLGRNALLAAGEGGAYGGLSAAGNAEGDVSDRFKAAWPGVGFGAVVGAAAAPAAAGVGAMVGAAQRRGQPAIDRAANALRSRIEPAAARARVNALRDAGIAPAAINVLDDAGRGYVAAAAKRQTPAREIVQQRADAARVNLPGRVSRQAQRLSTDPRTPDQIAQELGETRAHSAQTQFGVVRGEQIQMAPETVSALRTGQGRAAIAEAARRERDPEVRAALSRLANDALDDPSTLITVGMADRISRVLQGQAQAAARAGDNDLASTLGQLARDVREPTATAIPGYRAALDDYAQQSRIMEAAGTGEDFLRRNTDEFVADAPAPGAPGNDLARATARRAIERRAGESPAAALSTAESIAIAPEQMARTRAILPEEEAAQLERAMSEEVRSYRQLQQVAPRTGSPTDLNQQDRQAAADLIGAGLTAAGGPKAWLGALVARLRSEGISDADAQAVADIATDPAVLDDLIQRMERLQPGRGRWLMNVINESAARNAGEATTSPRQ